MAASSSTFSSRLLPSRRVEPSPFRTKEKVLVFFEQQLYEARVQRTYIYEMTWWRYYVHYNGYPKDSDEWVSLGRVLKYTPENVELMNELRAAQSDPHAITWVVDDPKPTKDDYGAVKKDPLFKMRDVFMDELAVLPPPSLLMWWIEDHDASLHRGRIPILPSTTRTVTNILNEYMEYGLVRDGGYTAPLDAFVGLLRLHFPVILPSVLFQTESLQYQQLVLNAPIPVDPCDIYIAEHLIRSFGSSSISPCLYKCFTIGTIFAARLPEVFNELEEDAMTSMQAELGGFLTFLVRDEA